MNWPIGSARISRKPNRFKTCLNRKGAANGGKKHGGTFTGRFDLAPGSRSREALDDYLEEKRDA